MLANHRKMSDRVSTGLLILWQPQQLLVPARAFQELANEPDRGYRTVAVQELRSADIALEPVRNRSASLMPSITATSVLPLAIGVLYEPAVTSWLVQFGQRTALTGISV
jgi:hypothetical protein